MESNNGFDPIKPADITLTQPASAARENKLPWQQQPMTYIALAISILLALAIIFILPLLIKPADTPAVIIKPQEAQLPSLKESPFKDAQLSKARRAAQDTLSQILEKQNFLEKKNIRLWDEHAFQSALDQAADGDSFYRQREFIEAQTAYQEVLSQFTALEKRIPGELSKALANGEIAMTEGDTSRALQHYELALAIDPGNSEAKTGVDRTATLDRVVMLLSQANVALEQQQLEQSQMIFQEALRLDPQHPMAINGAEKTSRLIEERDFNSAMSRGYSSLDKQQFNTASKAFNEALKLHPGHKGARSGLNQANNAAAQRTTQSQLAQGSALESKEQWHKAKDIYTRILAQDSSVIDARMGQIRSSARADLSDGIQTILSNPLRLASTSVYQLGKQLLTDAQGIRSPGHQLKTQISQLDQLLKNALIPVTVDLRSDNYTYVTLFKVGELGQFDQKRLSLTPGNYVAQGSRPGYRDVRIEFQVTSKGLPNPVIVACKEPVS
jgi:tetratricopeptide (TPR) repeat protein